VSSLQRVKAVIAYDGSAYYGFQKQKSTTKTITHEIEQALSSLQIQGGVVGSGRTDAGVHATGQVIHFDIPAYWSDLKKLTLNLNRKLTKIRFKHISKVDADFHARFCAKRRIYRYIFKTKKPSIFEQNFISYYPKFNIFTLLDALEIFRGEHDFAMFRKTGTDTHTSVRNIYKAYYLQRGDYHFIYFEANGFLRAQVRMMIDASMLCATHKLSIDQLKEQIDTKQKHTASLAPAQGLYLARVLY
jgi:tRNA pseudouridine38-40 synthase